MQKKRVIDHSFFFLCLPAAVTLTHFPAGSAFFHLFFLTIRLNDDVFDDTFPL